MASPSTSNAHQQQLKPQSTVPSAAAQNPNPNPVISKKRPIEGFQEFPYFKLRALVRDLRPLFLEVIKAPDIRDSKAAVEIQEKMKPMLDLCREMAAETTAAATFSNAQENKHELKPTTGHPQDMKPTEHLQADRKSTKSAADRRFPTGNNSEKLLAKDEADKEKSYIVGGSAFGWNFVTFNGTKVVYYGRTKESFRAAKAKS
ncbi:hypothetical protein Droror1_Dr00004899 [Drosera rotundifolia]